MKWEHLTYATKFIARTESAATIVFAARSRTGSDTLNVVFAPTSVARAGEYVRFLRYWTGKASVQVK